MEADAIRAELRELHSRGKRIFLSSSFQTHSIPLLHIASTSGVPFDVLFLQTRFHFPETLAFRNQVRDLLGLRIVNVESNVPMHMQRDTDGRLPYVRDPEHCCRVNKTLAMEPYLDLYDVWVNGVRRNQSAVREGFTRWAPTGHRAERFHPLLDWTDRQIWEYRTEHSLPKHPLEDAGYVSIGCAPCTRRRDSNDPRQARWFGMSKTECGLHTQLVGETTE